MAEPNGPTAPDVRLRSRAPGDWVSQSPENPFCKASFATPGGAVVSAFAFPTEGVVDELLAVANRFRGTVGLEPIEADELPTITKPVETLGREGHLIECVGDNEALLAVVVETPGVVWFLKLSGPSESVALELAGFHPWLATLSLSTDSPETNPGEVAP